MNRNGNGFTRSMRVVLLGALVALLAVSAAYAQGNVLVDAKVTGTTGFGKAVRGTVAIQIKDGSRLRSVTWTQIAGATARLIPQKGNAVRVKLGDEATYRKAFVDVLEEAPVAMAPPNIPVTQAGFFGGLQDRWQVVAINPLALEEGGVVTLEVTVNTTSGIYKDTVSVSLALPFGMSTGLNNVPVNEPVLLCGKKQASYEWTLTRPFASDAVLRFARTQTPSFTPDAPGVYELRVTDLATGQPVTLTVYAGTWRGVVVGQDVQGNAIADTACTNCHNVFAPDKFTPWSQTGHSKIFTDNLNTSDHYGTSCFSCHTVGYNPKAVNAGIDEAPDFSGFLGSDLLHGAAPTNWSTMLGDFPMAAEKANIQCENCHGPQVTARDDSPAHGLGGEAVGNPRITLSSDLCGSCHGEPTRHARYQQWQISGHANYETAIGEGTNPGCAKCHSAQGFLQMMPVLSGKVPGNAQGNVTVTWTADEVHPQTCVTCHDPHDVGTTTASSAAIPTDAKVRISGDTVMLDSGFRATGIGSGAICATCHNSRRGLKNDNTFSAASADQAPHVGTQADLLFGQNLYFVNTGVRGRHSLIENTCVNCHMEKSKPPAALSNALAGSNHTFFASIEVCKECHTGVNGENLANGFEAIMADLKDGIEARILKVMGDQIALGNKIDIGGTIITKVNQVASLDILDSHGRQAVNVVLTNGKHIDAVQMGSVKVVQPGGSVTLYSVTDTGLPKAFWNYLVVETDGSKGAHNPTFILDALNESLKAVGATPKSALAVTKSDLIVGMK